MIEHSDKSIVSNELVAMLESLLVHERNLFATVSFTFGDED